MAKRDYQLLAETFGEDSPVVPKYRTLHMQLQEIALCNRGMLERKGKHWMLWIPEEGEYIEPNLESMQVVMATLWPHAFI
jgi:hypothetical protein